MDKKKSELVSTLRTVAKDKANISGVSSEVFSSGLKNEYKRSSSSKNENHIINKLSDKFKISRNSFTSPKKDLIKSRKKEFEESYKDKEGEFNNYGLSTYSVSMTMPINEAKAKNGIKKSSDDLEGKVESKAMQMLEKMREKANQQNNDYMFGLVQPKQKVK